MSDQTWQVDVDISTIVRRTLTITVEAGGKDMAEAIARASVEKLHHDQLPDGYHTIRWTADRATAKQAKP